MFCSLFCSSQQSLMSDLKVPIAFKRFTVTKWKYDIICFCKVFLPSCFWEVPIYKLGTHNYDMMCYRFSFWINCRHWAISYFFLSFHLTNTGSFFRANATLEIKGCALGVEIMIYLCILSFSCSHRELWEVLSHKPGAS